MLAGVFVLALIALIVDRATTGGPETASAYEVERPAAGAAPSRAIGAGAASLDPASPAEDWLSRLPDAPEVRDLFAPPRAKAGGHESAAEADADPAAEFAAAHRLEATFQAGGVGCAMVNGRVVRPSQSIGGFRLIRVDAFRAVFRRGQHEAVLAMNPSTPGPETRPSNGR